MPFMALMVGSFVFFFGFLLFAFISHPVDVTKELANLAVQGLWPKVRNAILIMFKSVVILTMAGAVSTVVAMAMSRLGFDSDRVSIVSFWLAFVVLVIAREWIFNFSRLLFSRAFPRT